MSPFFHSGSACFSGEFYSAITLIGRFEYMKIEASIFLFDIFSEFGSCVDIYINFFLRSIDPPLGGATVEIIVLDTMLGPAGALKGLLLKLK